MLKAKIQIIYHQDKGDALRFITDNQNFVEKVFPSPDVCDGWRCYSNIANNLETPKDLYFPLQNQVAQATPSLDAWVTEEKLECSIRTFNKSSSTGLNGLSCSDLQHIRRQDFLNVINGIFAFTPAGMLRGRVTLILKISNPVA